MSQQHPNTPFPPYQQPSHPPAKKLFWTRLKVGAVAGTVGLCVGLAGASSGDVDLEAAGAITKSDAERQLDEAVQRAVADAEDTAAEDQSQAVDQAVAEATSDLEAQMQTMRENAAANRKKAVKRAVASATKKVQEQAKADLKKAVANARAEGRAAGEKAASAAAEAAAPAPAPAASSGGGGGTDPQFSYCYEANDAGYGNYVSGQDPEYDWYDDRDGDGVVCEF